MQTEELTYLENKIYRHLKSMSNTNVASGISRAFSDDDDEIKSNLLTKVEAHSKKHQATATISAYNTATVKELFNMYPAVEVQNALSSLKKKNLILQLGRGRGRAFVIFDTSEAPGEQAEPIEELAQLGTAMRPEEVAEETAQVEEEVVAESAPTEEEVEEQEEETVDDVDILEEALDTIYKLFQRKRTEEQDRLKDMENLQHEIEQLKKQVERLQENQTDIELTTWR